MPEKTLSEVDRLQLRALLKLQEWEPNPPQVRIGTAIFRDGARIVFARLGRNCGKSYGAVGFCCKWAIENPGSRIYYYAPLLKQVKSIVWRPKLWEHFLPAEFIDHIDKQDFVITLKNESYIQLDGSENFDATRGIKPHFVVADEYADFHPGWHIAMKPNLLAHRAALLMMGTPPEFPVLADGESHHYCLMDVECQNRMKQQKKVFWLKATSFDNPRIDPAELEEEKERLFARGEAYVWEREYMAEIVAGSNLRIFPMFSATRHYEKQPGSILKKIQDDPDRYEFWCGADPATKSTFAVLFIAIDRYTATPYFLDEIYEKDQSYTIASRISPLVVERCKKIAPEHPWSYICDEAAASFMEESANLPDCPIYWNPTCKQLHDKQSGIQLFKTILLEREQIISAECEHFGSELLNYQTNYRGLTVKLHDHLIDICRYVLREANFTLRQSDYFKQVEEDPEENNYLISVAEWEHRQRTKEDLFYELVM